MWLVKLRKVPILNDFRKDFFPRRVYYKKDALALQKEVLSKGGESSIERTK